MSLPGPPSLKATIIQLNKDSDPDDNNFEILSNEYRPSSSCSVAAKEEPPRKKRRRSTQFLDDREIAKRRTETKQLHSIIEKRRRIKINREFEALKYIIPACRNTDDNGKKGAGSPTNNSSKIDGMYKLTILKSLVEYILYLHHIIQKQHDLLKNASPDYVYDIGYTQVPLNVNEYRNIDKEFVFAEQKVPEADKLQESESEDQLPSPDVTPEIAPILSMLSKYQAGLAPDNTSPLTVPAKTTLKRSSFVLPDPAIPTEHPKKMIFKSRVPRHNLTVHIEEPHEKAQLEDASKALLAFRKPSIEKLLN